MKKILLFIFMTFIISGVSYGYSKISKCSSYSDAEKLVSVLENKLGAFVYTEVRQCPNCNSNTAAYRYFTANYNSSIEKYEDCFFVGKCDNCNYLEIGHEGIDVVNGIEGSSKREWLYRGIK